MHSVRCLAQGWDVPQNLGLMAILSCSRVSALAASAHGKDASVGLAEMLGTMLVYHIVCARQGGLLQSSCQLSAAVRACDVCIVHAHMARGCTLLAA